ncbi:hypothetical protein [Citricoccus sp.]|uniref:hypothetical protein n=1 Tax=Citricoccus sp. TaxID=1978372 RepID=UPI0028BDEF02|nr:hypothetical protein [Citricoccus sp.]
MIQNEEAMKIYRKWEQDGRPTCDHTRFDQELYLGSKTDDHVCLDCGNDFSKKEMQAIIAARSTSTAVGDESAVG